MIWIWCECFWADDTTLESWAMQQGHELCVHWDNCVQRCKQFCEQLNKDTLCTGETNMSFSSGRTDTKQNKGTRKNIPSLRSRTCWEPQVQIPTWSFHLNVSGQWSREFQPLCFPYVDSPDSQLHVLGDSHFTNNIRGDEDLQSLWPASSENVLVNLLLLHCGHCLWDWTFPHGSRKQQTNVCTD